MKWNGMGRGLKATAVSLALGLGITACSRDYTVAYLYVTSATRTTTGEINAYAVDYQSGSLAQLADSPIPSGGSNPVALVAAPNARTVYVINHDTSTVVRFAVGTDGKLYGQTTTNLVQGNGAFGTFPVAASIDKTGNFLYVAFTFQNGFTTARPGPGGVAVYPITHSSDSGVEGTLGSPLTSTVGGATVPYFAVGNNPTGIVASPGGGFVYVVDQEKPTGAAPFGVLLAFAANTTTGALTPVAGPVSGGFAVGTSPSAIAEDPAGSFLYVTDQTTNQLFGFSIQSGGAPLAQNSSPYSVGLDPLGVTIDPRGAFVYVANFGSSTVSAFAINRGGNGALSGVAGSAGVATGPTCVTVEPALGIYLYTSNNTDNSVSGAQLDSHTGSLKQVQGTQFSAQPLPTCAVTVANGAHATALVD